MSHKRRSDKNAIPGHVTFKTLLEPTPHNAYALGRDPSPVDQRAVPMPARCRRYEGDTMQQPKGETPPSPKRKMVPGTILRFANNWQEYCVGACHHLAFCWL